MKFVFRSTSVLPLEIEKIHTDPGAIHLFYIQAVYNVIHSNYPCTIETAVELGGIQLQLTIGDRNPEIQKIGYLKDGALEKYIPEHLLFKRKSEEWEQSLFDAQDQHKGKDQNALRLDYLTIVREWKYYGSTFFMAEAIPVEGVFFSQEFGGKVRIGVNQNGIHIIDPLQMKIVSHPLDTIGKFDAIQRKFFFEVQTESKDKGPFSIIMRSKKNSE